MIPPELIAWRQAQAQQARAAEARLAGIVSRLDFTALDAALAAIDPLTDMPPLHTLLVRGLPPNGTLNAVDLMQLHTSIGSVLRARAEADPGLRPLLTQWQLLHPAVNGPGPLDPARFLTYGSEFYADRNAFQGLTDPEGYLIETFTNPVDGPSPEGPVGDDDESI